MKTPKLLLLLLSIVLIYVFDTTFDRGLKVRLFCSPQWIVATCDCVAFCDVLGFLDAVFFCNNFMLPKRRFWKAEPTVQNAISRGSTFQRFVAQIEYSHP